MGLENKLKNNNISVSVLNAENIEEFLGKLKLISTRNNLADIAIHYDVMDGEFVKNHGVDIEMVEIAKKFNYFVDVHLMVKKPLRYINRAVMLGANSITVHVEIDGLFDILTRLNELKKDGKISNIGLAIKPETDIKELEPYLYLVDMILVMTVEPGKGMQAYQSQMEEKMLELKSLGKILQVDGGINNETIITAKESGATSFVVGSYLTQNIDSLEKRIIEMYKLRSK